MFAMSRRSRSIRQTLNDPARSETDGLGNGNAETQECREPIRVVEDEEFLPLR
jgi:hypothetical protein